MCRWLAYSGSPVLLEELLYKPKHSLIDQSLHSRMGAETTNGDGFGVGWYGDRDTPGVFHSIEPAWNDRNLRELAAPHPLAARLRAHPRLDRTPVQQTNCHPFRHGRWLWMHNGADPRLPRRSSATWRSRSIPTLYPFIEGSTDSETLLLPRADLRPRGRPAGRRSRGRSASSRRSGTSTASSTRSR